MHETLSSLRPSIGQRTCGWSQTADPGFVCERPSPEYHRPMPARLSPPLQGEGWVGMVFTRAQHLSVEPQTKRNRTRNRGVRK